MKAFLFSDLHSNAKALGLIIEILNQKDIDVAIFSGDLVSTGEPLWFAKKAMTMFKDTNKPFLWVPGNNDFGRSYYKMQSIIKSVEGRIVDLKKEKITGVGGSPASWSGQYQGETKNKKINISGTVFISHVPPPGINNWKKADNYSPIGPDSESENANSQHLLDTNIQPQKNLVTKETKQFKHFLDAPKVHICGHIHHTWGVGQLGSTKIVKLAAVYMGHYAIMDIDTLNVKFERFWK